MRLLSVPHSGTRFAMDVLNKAGLQEAWHKNMQAGDFIFAHFNNKHNRVVYGYNTMPTIVPLREYEEVVKSWERRGKNIKQLESLWQEMTDYVEKYAANIYFLRIDNPSHRENDLAMISELLGTDLKEVDFNKKIGEGT